jgi:hypothetical protein
VRQVQEGATGDLDEGRFELLPGLLRTRPDLRKGTNSKVPGQPLDGAVRRSHDRGDGLEFQGDLQAENAEEEGRRRGLHRDKELDVETQVELTDTAGANPRLADDLQLAKFGIVGNTGAEPLQSSERDYLTRLVQCQLTRDGPDPPQLSENVVEKMPLANYLRWGLGGQRPPKKNFVGRQSLPYAPPVGAGGECSVVGSTPYVARSRAMSSRRDGSVMLVFKAAATSPSNSTPDDRRLSSGLSVIRCGPMAVTRSFHLLIRDIRSLPHRTLPLQVSVCGVSRDPPVLTNKQHAKLACHSS